MSESHLFNTSLEDWVHHELVSLPPTASITEVAQQMSQKNVSSVLLIDPTSHQLAGIVTDRDLRNRVLAVGKSPLAPALDIATTDLIVMDARDPAFMALLAMARDHIHHVPVMRNGVCVGLVSSSDLIIHESASPVFLAAEVQQAQRLEDLVRISKRITRAQRHLHEANTSARGTGQLITTITDAITRRLLALAHAELGPAPVPYVWMAAGSQGRSEQTAKSDQDNALMMDDAFNVEQHGAYFEQLARRVCDGLNACGFVYCPGNMMAMNPEWRLPVSAWRQLFHKWVHVPQPMALMLSSVFFDVRAVAGQTELLDSLRQEVLTGTRGNTLFLGHLVGNALKNRPPLNWRGTVSLPRSGEHPGTVDLKHNGMVPIIDLARLLALSVGHPAVNTWERLNEAGTGEISAQSAIDLSDALSFLGGMRIAHQVRRDKAVGQADNFMPWRERSHFEQAQFMDAFKLIASIQSTLAQRYR